MIINIINTIQIIIYKNSNKKSFNFRNKIIPTQKQKPITT